MHLYLHLSPRKARHSLTRRWRRYKLNRKLRSRIQALTAEAADYSAQLADTNWVDTCMKAAGQMSSKSTWRLFRSLLDPSTTRGKTQRQLRRAYYAYQGPTSQLANDLCDRYLCRSVDPKGPEPNHRHASPRAGTRKCVKCVKSVSRERGDACRRAEILPAADARKPAARADATPVSTNQSLQTVAGVHQSECAKPLAATPDDDRRCAIVRFDRR
ncbi:hypothetical protein HPB49_020157 [Dermacentor silvarum]|uniref:Uncharacterized protein n=1 Tax=Dermacentor silvarum TaxID=543639 RepID=A0ACB8CZP4_DERSI|nr:hypothetical protein HPB49_020157 [Dermacentor silvarum]